MATIVRGIRQKHPWVFERDPDARSWILPIATAAFDSFVAWFENGAADLAAVPNIFETVPRSVSSKVTLKQAVDLVQTGITTCDGLIDKFMPQADRAPLHLALLRYSSYTAFAGARLYAPAADAIGLWDEQSESLIIGAVMRDSIDDTILARASALGLSEHEPVCVLIGQSPPDRQGFELLRQKALNLHHQVIGAIEDKYMINLASATSFNDSQLRQLAETLRPGFGTGPIVIGPVVAGLARAHDSAAEAKAAIAVADSWPNHPPVMTATDLLPERVLAGDAQARFDLVEDVYQPLAANTELINTCINFLNHQGNINGTARDMYVHPNTVRYRLESIQKATGYSPTDARGTFTLRLAITLGRQGNS